MEEKKVEDFRELGSKEVEGEGGYLAICKKDEEGDQREDPFESVISSSVRSMTESLPSLKQLTGKRFIVSTKGIHHSAHRMNLITIDLTR